MLNHYEFPSCHVRRRRNSVKDCEPTLRKCSPGFVATVSVEERCVRQCLPRVNERCESPPRCFPLRAVYSISDIPNAPRRPASIIKPKISLDQIQRGRESWGSLLDIPPASCDKSSRFEITCCLESLAGPSFHSWPSDLARRDVPASSNLDGGNA